MTKSEPLLSRNECRALRGLAIIGIVMHNFCHWLGPVVKENEYQFLASNVDWFSQVILHPDERLLAHLFSFFGHYGVPVFLFLSAYGLVSKYELQPAHAASGPRRVPAGAFTGYHFLKLFKMMIVGFVAFTMLDAITPGAHHYHFIDVVAQLLMFNNLLPHPDAIIWPGPYWFFGLMLQLYIVYRLLFYRRRWTWIAGAMVACWLLQVFCDPEGETLNRLRYNCIGGMLPFGLGLLYARYGHRVTLQWSGIVAVLSALLIVACSYSYQAWFFVPAFVCTFCVGAVRFVALCRPLMSHLEWVGALSAALFVCHPITRKIFIPISRGGDLYTGLLLYVAASLCVAWLFRLLMTKIPNPRLNN